MQPRAVPRSSRDSLYSGGRGERIQFVVCGVTVSADSPRGSREPKERMV